MRISDEGFMILDLGWGEGEGKVGRNCDLDRRLKGDVGWGRGCRGVDFWGGGDVGRVVWFEGFRAEK